MNKKILLIFIAFVLFGLGSVLGGSYMLLSPKEKIPPDVALYNKLLTDEKARELYGILCGAGGAMNGANYYHNEEGFEASCANHRNEQIKKWEELLRTTKNSAIQAHSLYLMGQFLYASAYDFNSLESAKLAVQALEASLAHESGSAQDGFSEFDVKRRETLEMAHAKRVELEKKGEEQGRAQAQVPISSEEGERDLKKDSEGRDISGGTENIGEKELPVVAPGAKP